MCIKFDSHSLNYTEKNPNKYSFVIEIGYLNEGNYFVICIVVTSIS